MLTYRSKTSLLLMLGCLFLVTSCKESLIEPEHYGVIQGVLINEDDDSLVSNVAVTTTPATVAITSDSKGRFKIEEVQAGQYTIHSKKKGYKNSGVNVSVRKDRVTDATIFLSVDDEDPSTNREVAIEVTGWRNNVATDTTFVNVEYKVENTGEADIKEYEVYFKIITNGAEYYKEVVGSDLRKGQIDFGEFDRPIYNSEASDVLVNGHWISSEDSTSTGS